MMKSLPIARLLRIMLVLLASSVSGTAGQLTVRIEHRWQGSPLRLGELGLRTNSGDMLSVTRLSYLLSKARLQRADGSWIGANDWFAFVDPEKERTTFSFGNVPTAKYTALRFDLGLDPETDRSDPAAFSSDHPLNPDVNGLHWGWRGGYVFFAIEGHTEEDGGYSYHLAGEKCRGTVEVPADLDLTTGDVVATLAFDVERVFGAQHNIEVSKNSSTHSRDDDPLAERLADNAVRAFVLLRVEPLVAQATMPQPANVLPPGPDRVEIKLPAHFPKANWPADNIPTISGVALGQRLFHEPRLSRNGSQSCATCHDPTFSFADPRPVSLGVDAQRGTRNSMPLFNLAWKPAFFWDGRAATLREQVLQPITDPLEMNESLDRVLSKLDADASYRTDFEKTFGPGGITAERLSSALEQFLLTLISTGSRFERALQGEVQLTDDEKRGFELFFTESDPAHGIRGADCFHCHGGANFSNHQFLNNGLDSDTTRQDEGRFRVTARESDRGRFMVPSLRNVSLTGPYMHDGRFTTLEQVIEHYDHGVKASTTLDPNLAKHLPYGGLGLSTEEKRALVAFLNTLTGGEQSPAK